MLDKIINELDSITKWNELNPDNKIRPLFNGGYWAVDLPNGTQHCWTAAEAISCALDSKYSQATEQHIMDRPSLAQQSINAGAKIIHINQLRDSNHETF